MAISPSTSSMHDDTDLDSILNEIRAGNVDSYTAIVVRYHAPVRLFVFARCPVGGDPDEIVQRVFLSALNNIDRYQPGTDFQAWLVTIARYEIMTENTRLRRELKNRTQFAQIALADAIEERSLNRDSVDSPLVDALDACVETLPVQHRTLVDLRYENGLNLAEIAERTNRSVGSLKKTFFAIRQRLRLCVEQRLKMEGL
jgi:RNA polymerase sigma-70 factor, ECF subfamily